MELTWNIMMRTMEGQGPKIQSILVRPAQVDPRRSGRRQCPENCSEASDKWFTVGQAAMGRQEYLTNSSCVPPIRRVQAVSPMCGRLCRRTPVTSEAEG